MKAVVKLRSCSLQSHLSYIIHCKIINLFYFFDSIVIFMQNKQIVTLLIFLNFVVYLNGQRQMRQIRMPPPNFVQKYQSDYKKKRPQIKGILKPTKFVQQSQFLIPKQLSKTLTIQQTIRLGNKSKDLVLIDIEQCIGKLTNLLSFLLYEVLTLYQELKKPLQAIRQIFVKQHVSMVLDSSVKKISSKHYFRCWHIKDKQTRYQQRLTSYRTHLNQDQEKLLVQATKELNDLTQECIQKSKFIVKPNFDHQQSGNFYMRVNLGGKRQFIEIFNLEAIQKYHDRQQVEKTTRIKFKNPLIQGKTNQKKTKVVNQQYERLRRQPIKKKSLRQKEGYF